MKIYLAAGYSKKNEIKERANELRQLGVIVTSRWLEEPHDPHHPAPLTLVEDQNESIARTDIEDINEADALAIFTQDPTVPFVRGGRMVEFGYALALKHVGDFFSTINPRRLMVIGPKENIFMYLPDVEVYATWEEFKERIAKDVEEERQQQQASDDASNVSDNLRIQ